MNKYKAHFSPGGFYHVYNHAIAWENLFKTRNNYAYFMERYYVYMFGLVDLHAYCLMPNHYHLMIKVKDNIGDILETDRKVLQAFGNFHNSYSKSMNKVFKRKGRLFQSTICRRYLTDERDVHNVNAYIRNNPVEHGFCSKPEDYPYLWTRNDGLRANQAA
jgi:putative transposase